MATPKNTQKKAGTSSQITNDHEVIQKWVEERDGVPATVKTTKTGKGIGVLRIKFPGQSERGEKNLEEISWDEFFVKFDENNLRFLYQEKTKEGELSRFFKFIRGK